MIPSGLVIGYHGCDADVADAVVNRRLQFQPSRNDYDWLGHGIYFWQDDPQCAWDWALKQSQTKGGHIRKPAVLGATIDVGNCFVAARADHIGMLRSAHERLQIYYESLGLDLPRNVGRGWANRKLVCLVFEFMHRQLAEATLPAFDTVLAYFPEGKALYPGAAIRHQDHVQICVRSPASVIGWFMPTQEELENT
jgi:hypothetical protein